MRGRTALWVVLLLICSPAALKTSAQEQHEALADAVPPTPQQPLCTAAEVSTLQLHSSDAPFIWAVLHNPFPLAESDCCKRVTVKREKHVLAVPAC